MGSSVGIIGAGISGLTLAYELLDKGYEVTVFEAGSEPGGAMKSRRTDGGWVTDIGPNTIMARTTNLQNLVDRLGITDRQVFANKESKKRYVVRNSAPVALPSSAAEFLSTPLFSASAKLNLLKEPFIPAWKNAYEETLADFVQRRLGREFLDYAINPFVAGVYAGRPETLSVRHAFPRLYQVEQEYGSLILGQILGARKRRKRDDVPKTESKLFSFDHGTGVLTDALGKALGDRLKTEHKITSLEEGDGKWTLTYKNSDKEAQSTFDRIVLTSPVHKFDDIGFQLNGTFPKETLQRIWYPPVTSMVLGFHRDQVRHPLDGFGMLVPAAEPFKILGTLFSSTLFPYRAPKDYVTLTTFVGGARYPKLALKSRDEIKSIVLRDLEHLLGVEGAPVFEQATQWKKAIPQYDLNYGTCKDLMDDVEQQHPGFYFAGNYRGGISVSDCITNAQLLAERIRKEYEPAY